MPLTLTLHCHLFISTTEQNQWLRENIFDVHGNYLYCLACIVSNLGVHTERLPRQREIKVNQCQEPAITLAKREVIEKKLQSFMLYPMVNDICGGISDWWDTLLDDDTVEVKYPHERHGLAGRMSNHSKPQVQEAFCSLWMQTAILMVARQEVIAHNSSSSLNLQELTHPN